MGIGFQTGYVAGRPSKAGQSYPDFISCWSGLTAILAALIERDRSGLGQRIDQGMYQVGVAVMPEAVLHYQVHGTEFPRRGAQDLEGVVTGVFETCDHDKWVAISIRDLDEFARLSPLMDGITDSLESPTVDAPTVDSAATIDARHAVVARWASSLHGPDIVAQLQALGIAAGQVLDMREVMMDDHLIFRGFYEDVDLEGALGIRPLIGRPYIFQTSRSAGVGPRVASRSPHYGEHNRYILAEMLGMDDDEIAELSARGIIATVPTKQPNAKAMDVAAMISKGSFRSLDPDYRARLTDRQSRF
jgi:crotonobetainyl-CoA:carnitine CoA-transferase CaiB-like acyl-CoA transferase